MSVRLGGTASVRTRAGLIAQDSGELQPARTPQSEPDRSATGLERVGPRQSSVSVSIVTFNSAHHLPACLAGLQQQEGCDLEVTVVDNASDDDSAAVAGDLLPTATVIRNRQNVGFAAAQNQGIAASAGEFVMALNPDVRLAPGYLGAAVATMLEDSTIGTVCGKLLLTPDEPAAGAPLIDSTGLYINRCRRQGLRGHGEPDHGQYDHLTEVFGACGAAPLYRRAMLEDASVNGEVFDTDFFIHKEDVDLAWRAQVLGWKAAYVPTALAYHQRHFRPGSRAGIEAELRRHAVKNRYLTIVKNDPLLNLALHLPWVAVYDLGIVLYLVLREPSSLPGIAGFLRLLPRALAKRRNILARRQVSRRHLRRMMRRSWTQVPRV